VLAGIAAFAGAGLLVLAVGALDSRSPPDPPASAIRPFEIG
jgi:hypothetical protein